MIGIRESMLCQAMMKIMHITNSFSEQVAQIPEMFNN